MEDPSEMEDRPKSRKYFYRQMLISSGGWTCYFLMGLSFGAPAVFIPQMRSEANSMEAVSEDMASWIPAVQVYAGLPWSLMLPVLMNRIGRKHTFGFVGISNLISFILLYCSSTINVILISEIINGINTGSHFTVSVLIITEYTSPSYRGFFLSAKSATLFWGIFIANIIGTFFHWKNIGIVGIACSFYSLVITFILPESPYWLSTRNQFKACAKSHRWLMGRDPRSESDLQNLLVFQRKLQSDNNEPKNFRDLLLENVNVVRKKQFYKPLFLCFLVQCLYVFSGKVVFSIYVIEILTNITKGQSISPYTAMLVLDGVTVFFMYIGCIFAKILPRRRMLMGSCALGIIFLLSISLYSYLIELSVVGDNNYVSVALLIGYSIGICCGPVILSQTITGELVSIESRGLSSCCIDLSLKIILGTLLKFSPYLFKFWGTHGAFFFYGATTSVFLVLIYILLPETKDKSLHEIAKIMKGSKEKPILQEQIKFIPKTNEN